MLLSEGPIMVGAVGKCSEAMLSSLLRIVQAENFASNSLFQCYMTYELINFTNNFQGVVYL